MSAINETLVINILEKGYEGKEWKDGETSGKDKHRVYVIGPSGEIGYLDVKNCKFTNFNKSGIAFGVVEDKKKSKIELSTQKGISIFLGILDDNMDKVNNSTSQRLQDAIQGLNNLDCESKRVDISLSPSFEVKLPKNRVGWAKASISVSVENPKDVQDLYDAVSELTYAMLNAEEQKLRNR
jgi:hypothetical protein